jgi:hypothetical protein
MGTDVDDRADRIAPRASPPSELRDDAPRLEHITAPARRRPRARRRDPLPPPPRVLRARDRTRERDTTSISQVVPSPVELPDASVARRDGRDRLMRILDATDEAERRVFVLARWRDCAGARSRRSSSSKSSTVYAHPRGARVVRTIDRIGGASSERLSRSPRALLASHVDHEYRLRAQPRALDAKLGFTPRPTAPPGAIGKSAAIKTTHPSRS